MQSKPRCEPQEQNRPISPKANSKQNRRGKAFAETEPPSKNETTEVDEMRRRAASGRKTSVKQKKQKAKCRDEGRRKKRKGKETKKNTTEAQPPQYLPILPNTQPPHSSSSSFITGADATESIDDLGLAAALDTALPPPGHVFRREHRRTSCLSGETPPPSPVSSSPHQQTGSAGQGRTRQDKTGQQGWGWDG